MIKPTKSNVNELLTIHKNWYQRKIWNQCCDVRYDCRIKNMFGSSLPLVVCSRDYALFTLFLFVAYSGVQQILCCVFCFVCRRLVYPMLPVSLDCLFLIAPLIFSNVYFIYMAIDMKILISIWKIGHHINIL